MTELSPTPGQDVTPMIRDAIGRGERSIELPRGQFEIGDCVLSSNVRLRGVRNWTTLVRRGRAARMIQLERGAENVQISDLRFDMRADFNYCTAIDASDSIGCRIEHCHLRTDVLDLSREPPTNHAVLAKRSTGLRIRWCHTYQTQIKVNGGSTDAEICECVMINPRNFGVSVVTRTEDQEVSDIRILHNSVQRGFAGGIYVGADGDRFHGKARRILIFGNSITTGQDHNGGTVGILFRAGELAEDVLIAENYVSRDRRADPSLLDFGIYLKSINTPGTMRHVRLVGNQARGMRGHAIRTFIYDGDVTLEGNVADTVRLIARNRVQIREQLNEFGSGQSWEIQRGAELRLNGDTLRGEPPPR